MAAAVNPTFDKKGLAAEVLSRLLSGRPRPDWATRSRPYDRRGSTATPSSAWLSTRRGNATTAGLSTPGFRTHQRMGGRIVGPAPNSMVIPGTVRDWEQWADMVLPVSGEYVIPDALNLLRVNREEDLAVYHEENLWIEHR